METHKESFLTLRRHFGGFFVCEKNIKYNIGTMEEKSFKATNFDIAKAFAKIAEILEIQGESIFRIRAYERAAQMIDGLPEECGDIYEGGLARGDAADDLVCQRRHVLAEIDRRAILATPWPQIGEDLMALARRAGLLA